LILTAYITFNRYHSPTYNPMSMPLSCLPTQWRRKRGGRGPYPQTANTCNCPDTAGEAYDARKPMVDWGGDAGRGHPSPFLSYLDAFGASILAHPMKQESSAKLTNQRVSYAFTSSPFSFHARHILPIYPSSSIVILVFYLFSTGISEQHV